MRKYILLMMALLLLATIMPATADVPSDVPAEHWAVEAVRDLYNRGIFIGYPDDSFRGDRAVTRYELAVVLSRLLKNLPSGGDTSNFVTKTELQNTLKSYPTKTELQTTLNNYLTKAELQNTLNNYVTKTEFENRLANLATKEDIARLQRLVDNLRTDLTALGVRVDEVQRRLAALETRVGKLEERVTLLEQRPAGGISFNMIGGVAARNASVTDVIPGFEDLLVNEYDRPLVEGFSSGAAFDIMVGAGLTGSLGIGARVFAVNEDLTDANLENFDTNLGFFLTSDDTRLDLGVFDAEFTPFTLANGSESVLEQIPAFYNYWYFNGAKLSTNLGVFDTQLLISNTRDRDVNESQYDQTLFGARAAVKLSNTLGVAGNYVFINDDDAGVPIIVETGALPAFKNRVWSVNADLVAGSLGVYGEFADSRNEDIVNGGTVSGNAYKIGAMVGPVDAYYLKIGGVTDPFIAYYGDPAAATLFNGHDPGMGGFLDPARRILYFGQQPNLFYSLTAPRYDLNNNIRGYGATVGFNAARTDLLNPISPLLLRGAEDGAFRSALGYEHLSQIDSATITTEIISPAPGTLTTTLENGVFQTIMASLALDLSDSFTVLAAFKQRKVTADGTDIFTNGEPAISSFDVDGRQNTTSFGIAYRFSADSILALQHFILDYTDNVPEFNSSSSVTKATLSVKF
ncbi:MAG: S-layer homology domain-containing protein [bacterium]|jgi:hypothetical protein|nr:S-layer homology domain-containing protein [bacterium]MDD3804913.1 S-layer homology domain-containing protein [bacterium]MDD4153119.1 S-layer homology domain-containing protein [bacterium]MDD4557411.1 S-layer homology domain-containing protein [bacterium]